MYLKGALLFSAAAAGLLLLPGNAVNVIMSPIVGALFDKIGPRNFAITGSIIVLIGNIIFLTSFQQQHQHGKSLLPLWFYSLG